MIMKIMINTKLGCATNKMAFSVEIKSVLFQWEEHDFLLISMHNKIVEFSEVLQP